MTENKMPDVFWLSRFPHCGFYVEPEHDDDEECYRAEPIKTLLKQARDVIDDLARAAGFPTSGKFYEIMKNEGSTTRDAIDKFLEDKE